MRRHGIGLLFLALSGCIPPPDASALELDGSDVWTWLRLVEGPEGRTAVAYATPPLGEFEVLDDTRAREISGNGRLYVLGGQPYLGNSEDLTVVRSQIDENGTLVDDSPRLSFALTGLTFLPNWAAELNDDRALFIDSFEGLGVVWNREAMELEGTVDLSRLVVPPFEAQAENGLRRGDEILVPLQQVNVVSFTFFPGMQVAVLSAETGEVLEIIEDERCVGTRSEFWLDEDGVAYLAGENHGFAAEFTEQGAPSTCVLRILPNTVSFDPDYQLSLPTVLDGAEGRAFLYWKEGFAYASMRDEALVTQEFWDDPLEYGSQEAGRWVEIDLVAGTSRQLDMPPHTMLSSSGTVVDGRLLLQNPAGGLMGVTSIWEVEFPGAEPIERLSYPGLTPVIEALRSE